MILTLLSALGGGLMRILPELLALVNKKTDNGHELAMLEKQIELEKLQGSNRFAQAQLETNASQNVALWAAQGAALQGQMQKLGIWWVDAANFLVRPIATYWFLGCYGLAKTAMLVVAIRSADAWSAIIQCWAADDYAILVMILSFYFVGRAVDSAKGQK